MQQYFSLGMLALFLNSVPACQDGINADPQPVDSIELSSQEMNKVKADNQFTFTLFSEALKGLDAGENAMLSPLSVSMSVGMAANGAGGTTKEAIFSALNYEGYDQDFINSYYHKLIQGLPALDPEVQLEIANSIWYKSDFKVEPKFLKTNESYYEATARALDFSDPGATGIINSWVNQKTQGKISGIVDKIPTDMRMYLINALYFKGAWETPFKKERTQPATFHAPQGDVEAPFMHRQGRMQVLEGDGFNAIDLPYGEEKTYSMIAVLPSGQNDLAGTLEKLRSDPGSWTGEFSTRQVQLALPKFKFSYENTLNDELSALGMQLAMSENADLTGISKSGNLTISEVKHKTFIDVNEEGTEAAAVTSTGISVTSLPQYFVMNFDRPFLFLIRENSTGLILFTGVVNNPTK